jgi:AcrR family transcriptional regulator
VPDLTDERPYHHGNLRAALLDAAERVLREQGPDAVSLRDLAREVGVSHGAPRRHFGTRQDLLDALAVSGFVRLHEALLAALDGTGPGLAARLHAAATTYVRFATDDAALLELMYSSKQRPDGSVVRTASEAPFGLLDDLVVQGQADGVLQPGDAQRIGIVLFAAVHGLAAMANGGFVRPEALDDLVAAAVEQFLRGAAA